MFGLENILDAIPWVFSGIGVFILGLFIKNKIDKTLKQNQRVNNNSTGIQAGGNITITKGDVNGNSKPKSK